MQQNRTFKNIDGIKFLNHQGGCGGIRQDAAILGKLLAAYADHANVAGVTVLSLGCQNLQTADFLNDLKERNPRFAKPLFIFEQQQSQSEDVYKRQDMYYAAQDPVALVGEKREPPKVEFQPVTDATPIFRNCLLYTSRCV